MLLRLGICVIIKMVYVTLCLVLAKGQGMGKSLNGKELGEGITQRKDGRYVGRFTDRFGKRISVYGQTVNEIKKKIRSLRAADDLKRNVKNENITLSDWYKKCISTFKTHCRKSTLRTYDTIFKRIEPYMGHLKISEITTLHVQDMLNNMCSDKCRRDCKSLLSDLMKYAIYEDLIIKNPTTRTKTDIDNIQPEERVILSDEQVNIFLKRISSTSRNLHKIMTVALNTGMRCGEILGLCWDCIDFNNKVIITDTPTIRKLFYASGSQHMKNLPAIYMDCRAGLCS